MSRFLDLINGKPETPAPIAALAPVAKVVAEKPKVVVEEQKVEQKAPKTSEDKK
jgi:hypothetical protein